MKITVLILLLISTAWAQLPDAPSPTYLDIHLTHKTTMKTHSGSGLGKMAKAPLPDGANHPARNVIEVEHVHDTSWVHRHRKLTIALIVGGLAGTGLAIGLAQRHSCPSVISGFPYSGTYPCPKYCDAAGDCDWGPKK